MTHGILGPSRLRSVQKPQIEKQRSFRMASSSRTLTFTASSSTISPVFPLDLTRLPQPLRRLFDPHSRGRSLPYCYCDSCSYSEHQSHSRLCLFGNVMAGGGTVVVKRHHREIGDSRFLPARDED